VYRAHEYLARECLAQSVCPYGHYNRFQILVVFVLVHLDAVAAMLFRRVTRRIGTAQDITIVVGRLPYASRSRSVSIHCCSGGFWVADGTPGVSARDAGS
jgi:hypothetical protein